MPRDTLENPYWGNQYRKIVLLRSSLLRFLREYLHNHAFIEVETPIFCPVDDENVTDPVYFKHDSSGFSFSLERAVHLKRVSFLEGVPRAYEIRRRIRPDRPDSTHLPEFTSLEMVFKCNDFHQAKRLVEDMLIAVFEEFGLDDRYRRDIPDGAAGWPCYSASDLCTEWSNLPSDPMKRKRKMADDLQLNVAANIPDVDIETRWLEQYVEVNDASWVKYQSLPLHCELVFHDQLELLNLFSFALSPEATSFGVALGFDRLTLLIAGGNIRDVTLYGWK